MSLSRTSLSLSALIVILVGLTYMVFANEDLGTIQQDCVAIKNYTEAVTNGSCK